MNPEHDTPDYIFIVGMPRTGTNLLRNILNSAQQVHCAIGPETHFVGEFIGRGGRTQMRRIGDMNDDSNVRKLVDAMYAQEFAGNFWKQLADGRLQVDRKDLLQAFLATDRSERAIYSTLLRISPTVGENSIAGDKTPAHLFHVPTLAEWFPRARFVHTFRDPRAIYMSQIKKKRKEDVRGIEVPWEPGTSMFKLGLFVYTLAGWVRAAQLHKQYTRDYPEQYFLLQFEEFVADPRTTLETLCEFLNIELEPDMLTPIRTSSSYEARENGGGFDQHALNRWQRHINPAADHLIQVIAGKYMREFGYL